MPVLRVPKSSIIWSYTPTKVTRARQLTASRASADTSVESAGEDDGSDQSGEGSPYTVVQVPDGCEMQVGQAINVETDVPPPYYLVLSLGEDCDGVIVKYAGDDVQQ